MSALPQVLAAAALALTAGASTLAVGCLRRQAGEAERPATVLRPARPRAGNRARRLPPGQQHRHSHRGGAGLVRAGHAAARRTADCAGLPCQRTRLALERADLGPPAAGAVRVLRAGAPVRRQRTIRTWPEPAQRTAGDLHRPRPLAGSACGPGGRSGRAASTGGGVGRPARGRRGDFCAGAGGPTVGTAAPPPRPVGGAAGKWLNDCPKGFVSCRQLIHNVTADAFARQFVKTP